MHLNFFAYLETLGVLCIISRSANALLGFSASFTILSISYRVQKCKVTKIFASIWAADKRVVDLFWWLSSAYISLFSSRQQFRTLSCQVQLVFFSLIVIRVASLSVIETSFCQFRNFSERWRMLTHVFLDHKTCTQQLVLGKIFLQFWWSDYFYYLYLVIKELWKQQAFFLWGHMRSEKIAALLFFYELGSDRALSSLPSMAYYKTT